MKLRAKRVRVIETSKSYEVIVELQDLLTHGAAHNRRHSASKRGAVVEVLGNFPGF